MPMVVLLPQKTSTTHLQFLQLDVCIQDKPRSCKQLSLIPQLLLQEQVQHMKLQRLKAVEMDHQMLQAFSDSLLVDQVVNL